MGLIRALENLFIPNRKQHLEESFYGKVTKEQALRHAWERYQIDLAHWHRMQGLAYLNSPEHRQEINRQITQATHADIKPPWEDDDYDLDPGSPFSE